MFKKKKKLSHKFCPRCGFGIEAEDTYCTRCGYSFQERHEKHKKHNKKINWKNIIIAIIILLLIYISIQIFNKEPVIPEFITDLLNASKLK